MTCIAELNLLYFKNYSLSKKRGGEGGGMLDMFYAQDVNCSMIAAQEFWEKA